MRVSSMKAIDVGFDFLPVQLGVGRIEAHADRMRYDCNLIPVLRNPILCARLGYQNRLKLFIPIKPEFSLF